MAKKQKSRKAPRPRKPKDPKQERISVAAPSGFKRQVEEDADLLGISASELWRRVMEQWWEARKAVGDPLEVNPIRKILEQLRSKDGNQQP